MLFIHADGNRIRMLLQVGQDSLHQVAESARFDKRVVYHKAVILATARSQNFEDSTSGTEYDCSDMSAKSFMRTDCKECLYTVFSDDMAPSAEVADGEWFVDNRADEFANQAQVDQIRFINKQKNSV
ncbi:hypothetical protein KCU95_g11293, partial [Aureobasidium melanogenum]